MAGYPDAEILDIAGPIEVFSVADRFLRDKTGNTTPIYTTEIVALQAGTFTTSSGIRLIADRTIHDVRGTVDTLIVAGGVGTRQAMFDAKLISWLKDMAPRVRRLCSVCSGAFILAEAGLLDGRAATTHWRWCDTLSARYPAISVKSDPIFVQDGNVYTSAGVTAGIDLALAMVEDDHGRNLALAVARGLVLFLKRPGGQSQFSVQLTSQMAGREPIRELQVWVADHPDANLSVETLAERVAMSPRNFARVFRRETGMTPGTFVEISRVESARRRLEESAAGVDAIASECGFGTRESMRRAFLRVLGVPPSSYRERFRSAAPPALRRSAGT
ncbi:MAG TPA: GlxA family transcriptional regulator [Blastocatellia bacterium]|nr:GlxA family transcriptional regulator [Blastocatellia bacterium]